MKRIPLSVLLLLFFPFLHAQENTFELKVTLKPFKNQYIYLGYYYGKQRPIVDSVLLNDKSYGVFKADHKMGGGLYLIGYPDKSNYFEVFIDQQQHFSIVADTADIIRHSIKFTGSEDNILFNAYQEFVYVKGNNIEAAKKRLATATNAKDSATQKSIIDQNNEAIKKYRLDFIKAHPKSTLSLLFNIMKEPDIPPAGEQTGGKYDSAFAYQYYKNHYWDGVYFFDDRVARTPVFEPKLDKYFEQVVYPNADSVIKEMDWMLGYASASEEMQKFLLVKFVNRYLNQRYMWEDKVFVHLFEKYFSQKEYAWLNEKGKKTIFDRAYSLMANLIGNPASDIALPDTSGTTKTLYSVKNPYTVVVFWDPNCGHCQETLPRIDSIYRARWKNQQVAIYAVAKESDAGKAEWKKFIRAHNLEGWVHVYYSKEAETALVNSGMPGYSQLYDIQSVPTLYLLDSEKRILAKKIPFEQIDEVLQYKIKGK